jgi:hypothetical protein
MGCNAVQNCRVDAIDSAGYTYCCTVESVQGNPRSPLPVSRFASDGGGLLLKFPYN